MTSPVPLSPTRLQSDNQWRAALKRWLRASDGRSER